MSSRVLSVLASMVALILTSLVYGQSYPNKPIRIVTAGAGGGTDIASRKIAQGLSAPLGQPIIVDNRGGGVIPAETVSTSQPDGYTILVNGSPLWISPLLQKTSYDPIRSFEPISLLESTPNVLVVNPARGINSVKDLIILAKAKPGELNFSTGGTGGSAHLAGELFKSMAGINLVRVPYSSNSQETADLISGQIHMTFGSLVLVMPHVKSGRLKALAVTSAEPSELTPGLPTISASGLTGYEAATVVAMLAPAGTPAAVIERLSQEVVRYIRTREVRARYFESGVEPVGSTPAQLSALMKSDTVKWAKVIKEAGIRLDK